jgi:hypothetical protein
MPISSHWHNDAEGHFNSLAAIARTKHHTLGHFFIAVALFSVFICRLSRVSNLDLPYVKMILVAHMTDTFFGSQCNVVLKNPVLFNWMSSLTGPSSDWD